MENGRRTAARIRSALPASIMLLGAALLYLPAGGRALLGVDYLNLHQYRIAFAQEALATTGRLPGWYPRELMGTPFWADVQNFPFLPTRLALLWIDPYRLYGCAVSLAAALAAGFTYLYCRQLALARWPAAVAGWTFAAAGFFSARVTAGHLPLLEAYPALPLLLWQIERLLQGGRTAWRLACLAIACAAVSLSGHPQLPAYAIGSALLYLVFRAHKNRRLLALGCAAIVLGVGCAAFSLVPMWQLVARSTRVLPLEAPANDIAMPYARLKAIFLPWCDGCPTPVDHSAAGPFHGYPTTAYFWDTVCYVGLLPLIAAAVLIGRAAWRMMQEQQTKLSAVGFVAILGALALITALPLSQSLRHLLPITLLRSPARQLYLTSFALAVGLGMGLNLLAQERLKWLWPIAALAVTLHVWDLSAHARSFVIADAPPVAPNPAEDTAWQQRLGDGRIAVDADLRLAINRRFDDVGFFASIALARAYRGLLDLHGAPVSLNLEHLNGSALSARALAAVGVRYVLTASHRQDLRQVSPADAAIHIYAVADPQPRAKLFPMDAVVALPPSDIHQRLRPRAPPPGSQLMIPQPFGQSISMSPPGGNMSDENAQYRRPGPDEIVVTTASRQASYLRVLETWDPGWQGTVDGKPAQVVPGDDVFLAVPLPPGRHEVRLQFRTPGATTGLVLSGVSAMLLTAMCWAGGKSE